MKECSAKNTRFENGNKKKIKELNTNCEGSFWDLETVLMVMNFSQVLIMNAKNNHYFNMSQNPGSIYTLFAWNPVV